MSNKPAMQISKKVSAIPEALSIYINNLVYQMRRQGQSITTLSLGEAYFDIPMLSFDNINFQKGYHYSESRGLPELREKIASYYNNKYGAQIDADKNLIISAGSKPLIYMAMQAVLNSGDEVLVHEPAWLSYPEEAKLADAVPKFIPFDCSVEEFPNYFTGRTRMLVLNNPNNPAGRVYTQNELLLLYRECRSRGIYMLIDEAYSDFIIDGSFTSMAKTVPDLDGVIVINSLSKNFGISGWRVGYALSTPDVIYNILKLNQHLITCASTILLMYLAEHFDEMTNITIPQAQAVTEKRDAVGQYIDSIGLHKLSGSATFYFFISLDGYSRSSMEFAMYLLLKHNIAVVPGSAYGKSTDNFIRIGVGVESLDVLKTSLQTIKELIDNDEYDEEFVENTVKKLGIEMFINCGEQS